MPNTVRTSMNHDSQAFKVCEKFVSINGEGIKAGQLSVFVRFKGCNLDCSYCDTKWANEKDADFESMSTDEIVKYVVETSVQNVTLTGGEPLIQPGISGLIKNLKENDLNVEIETNGAVNLKPFCSDETRPDCFTMDYKLPESDMEKYMNTDNFKILRKKDTLKFVASSVNDLKKAKEIIEKYELIGKVNIIFSPVFGKIELTDIVDFLKDNKLNDVRMQLQMHKFIWDPEERGV